MYSILDQQQKQTVPFSGGRYMGEFDGRVFVATSSDIYYLFAIPVEKQVREYCSFPCFHCLGGKGSNYVSRISHPT